MLKKMLKFILPKSAINNLVEIKNNYFGGYAAKSYSQEGEDILLQRIFWNVENGFYVDVGAHHPKRFSNTYAFYKKGWMGINIDAMPNSMKKFNKERPRDINIEEPIANQKKELIYYAFLEPALNTLSDEIGESRIEKGEVLLFNKKMNTKTLEEVLDDVLPINKSINFLSIDVEGLDFDVLKSNNFIKYRPKIIVLEILSSTVEDVLKNDIFTYMQDKNYCLYSKLSNSVFFMDNEI